MNVAPDEVSAVIRLVQQLCDRWDDPRAWREHLLRGACKLLHGHVGMILADHGGPNHRSGRMAALCTFGVPPMRTKNLLQPAVTQWERRTCLEVSENDMPGLAQLYADIRRQGWATAARDELVDAATYHASPMYLNVRRQLDCDDFIVSIRFVDLPRRTEAISIDRPHGAPPFGPREVTLLKLLHDEIAPLIGVRLATEEHLSREGLSKRLRETLSLLLEGRSEKEAAAALGLAIRTVHDYVTMLYQHFEVTSRAELLAYFIRRTPVLRSAGR